MICSRVYDDRIMMESSINTRPIIGAQLSGRCVGDARQQPSGFTVDAPSLPPHSWGRPVGTASAHTWQKFWEDEIRKRKYEKKQES